MALGVSTVFKMDTKLPIIIPLGNIFQQFPSLLLLFLAKTFFKDFAHTLLLHHNYLIKKFNFEGMRSDLKTQFWPWNNVFLSTVAVFSTHLALFTIMRL